MIGINHLSDIADAINGGMKFRYLGTKFGMSPMALTQQEMQDMKASLNAKECAFGLLIPDDDCPGVLLSPGDEEVMVSIIKTNPHERSDEVLAKGRVPVDILNDCGMQYEDHSTGLFYWANEEWEAVEC